MGWVQQKDDLWWTSTTLKATGLAGAGSVPFAMSSWVAEITVGTATTHQYACATNCHAKYQVDSKEVTVYGMRSRTVATVQTSPGLHASVNGVMRNPIGGTVEYVLSSGR